MLSAEDAAAKGEIEFSRAAFGGDLAALGTEAGCVRTTPAVDGGVAGKIAMVSRAEGAAAELNSTDMALAAQAQGAVGLIAINDGQYEVGAIA